MPDIFITVLVDERQRPVLTARSLEEPDDRTVSQLAATAKRFELGEVDDVAYAMTRACRGCGCTEHEPCPEGCSWVDPDLCTCCAADHIIRVA
jgi:hypothetical protein